MNEVIDDGKVSVTIDGREIRVDKGTLLLDAASELGIHIPIYCAHPKMDPVAVCRMCLVDVEKMPKQQPACATVCSDGMVVTTNSPAVAKTREGVLEFLLLNHPLDCPVCDRGGECDLQDFAFRYGPETSRFPINEKVHFNKAVPLSEHIELDQERCILCWRCVRYSDEITGDKEIVLQQRGVQTLVDTYNGQPLTGEFQGNLPEVCPVGALTHREYRFVARPWDLQRVKNVCPECSYGCNINVDSRDYEIKRFASRDNPLVDDMWLCDRGRYSFNNWNNPARVHRATLGGKEAELEAAVAHAAQELSKFSGEKLGILLSPQLTNEELWVGQRLAREVLQTPNLDHQFEEFTDLSPREHELGIADIEACRAVVVLGELPERNAPVLKLRLHKAETKKKVAVHRVSSDANPAEILSKLPKEGLIGVVADESDRKVAKELADAISKSGAMVARMTVTRDVNGRGAKDLGVLPNYQPGYQATRQIGKSGAAILDSATRGEISGLILVGGAQLFYGREGQAKKALEKVEFCLAIESIPSFVSEMASVVIPGHSYMEKAGTVTNLEGRVQQIRQALPPATSAPSLVRVVTQLAQKLGANWQESDVQQQIFAAIPEYATAGVGNRAVWGVPV